MPTNSVVRACKFDSALLRRVERSNHHRRPRPAGRYTLLPAHADRQGNAGQFAAVQDDHRDEKQQGKKLL